jgi:HEAT repeat protein
LRASSSIFDILDHYTSAAEGEVQPVLMLALGQVWMRKPDPTRPGAYLTETDSPAAAASRRQSLDALMRYADAPQAVTRKAAILALAYWKGREEPRQAAVPLLVRKLQKDPELDVRMAAATAVAQIASPTDTAAIDALGEAMRDSDPHDVELVWNAAIALAQLDRPEAKDVVLRLLDRKELDSMQYYDRETDPQNPKMQPLGELEKERILINAMLACKNYQQPEVQAAIRKLAASDSSERVKQAASEILEAQGAQRVSAGGPSK